jgi:hypothetical protein
MVRKEGSLLRISGRSRFWHGFASIHFLFTANPKNVLNALLKFGSSRIFVGEIML